MERTAEQVGQAANPTAEVARHPQVLRPLRVRAAPPSQSALQPQKGAVVYGIARLDGHGV